MTLAKVAGALCVISVLASGLCFDIGLAGLGSAFAIVAFGLFGTAMEAK